MLARSPLVRPPLALRLLPLLLVLIAAASPVLGGTVYVAFVGDGEVDGVSLETTLVVSNPTDDLRFVSLDFLPGIVDGVRLEVDPSPEIYGIPARQTRVFTGLSRDLGTIGLLEVTGDDQLVVDARLRVTTDSGESRLVQLPVVGSDHVQEPNKLHVLPGWYRDDSQRTSFALINLSPAANECSLDLRALLGEPLMDTVVLTLPPVSMFYSSDPLAGIGVPATAESRLEVTCREPSYSYVLVTDLETGDVVRRGAAVDLTSSLNSEFEDDTSDPADPGDDPGSGGGGGNPGEGVIVESGPGFVRMRVPGVVHAPTRGNDRWIYRLDLPGISTIDSLTATVVVRTGPWGTLRTRPQHHLLQISNARWGDGGWDFWVRPDRTAGLTQTGLLATRGRGLHNEVVRGTMSGLPNNFRVSINQNGRRLDGHGLSLNQGVFPPRTGPLFIQLGANLGIPHDPKVPSYGWVWRDLEIEIRGR
ncbi:MAG TPA: hypothetical protein VMT85_23695 [Thermoanaerobaculia bacterium]|nr:hypothetical protein [Thermoanaerobaculia bacterium]